jgi:hypothetical protein
MKTSFPMYYSVYGRLTGRTMQKTYHFAETVELELEEVSEAEAPLAVSWACSQTLSPMCRHLDPNMSTAGEDGRQHTRYHDGRHWLRITEGHVGSPNGLPVEGRSPGLSTLDFMNRAGQGELGQLMGFGSAGHATKTTLVVGDPAARFEYIAQSGRDRAYALLERLPHRFLSVEGVVYKACNQPSVRLALLKDPVSGRSFPYPVVDTDFERMGKGNHRPKMLPLSMPTEAAYECSLGGPDGDWMKCAVLSLPVIHDPASISSEPEAVLAAGYYLRRYVNAAGHLRILVDVEEYYRRPDSDGKLDFLHLLLDHRMASQTPHSALCGWLKDAISAFEDLEIGLDIGGPAIAGL